MSNGERRVHIGMALYGDITFDSRVRREAAALAAAGFDVSIACLSERAQFPDLPSNVRVFARRPSTASVFPGTASPFMGAGGGRLGAALGKVRWFVGYVRNLRSWGRMAVEACGPVDLWHANDLTGLAAIAHLIPEGTPLVYDAHELFLETGTSLALPWPARALLRKYERRLVARTSAVLTVNEGLARVLSARYAPRRIVAIHNCPNRWIVPTPRPTLIKDAISLEQGGPVILYHGALSANRGIEQLMQAMLQPGLEQAHLAIMGFGEKREDYVSMAADGPWSGRVHMLDPVPPAQLLTWVASADLGAMPIQASTLNHYLSTPNKLFECLAAGTPVVTSDFPAMTAIVANDPAGPTGATCDPASVEALGVALRSILELDQPELERMRSRCIEAAHNRWNWELESVRLTELYADLCAGLDQ
jgi:glycosyltransferase involved in cell wall biosynthesis